MPTLTPDPSLLAQAALSGVPGVQGAAEAGDLKRRRPQTPLEDLPYFGGQPLSGADLAALAAGPVPGAATPAPPPAAVPGLAQPPGVDTFTSTVSGPSGTKAFDFASGPQGMALSGVRDLYDADADYLKHMQAKGLAETGVPGTMPLSSYMSNVFKLPQGMGSPEQVMAAMQLQGGDADRSMKQGAMLRQYGFDQQKLAQDAALEREKLASQEKVAGMHYSPDAQKSSIITATISQMLAQQKSPLEITQALRGIDSLLGQRMPVNPNAPVVPRGQPGYPAPPPPGAAPAPVAPGQSLASQVQSPGSVPMPGGPNPLSNLTEDQLGAVNQLIGQSRQLLTPDPKKAIGRADVENLLDAIAGRNLPPDARQEYIRSLLSDTVTNTPEFGDLLLRAAAKAMTNGFYGNVGPLEKANNPNALPNVVNSGDIPGFSIEHPAGTLADLRGSWRSLLAGPASSDAATYRTARYNGRAIPLDVADVSTGANGEAEVQKYKRRLPVISALLEEMKNQGLYR